MFSLFVTAEVVALTSGSYLLRLLHCKGSRWEYATEDHLLVLGQMESLKLWGCPEECKYALPVMLLKVLELPAVLHSSLQPTFLTFSFLCHTVFPDYIVPPCALNYSLLEVFCFILCPFHLLSLSRLLNGQISASRETAGSGCLEADRRKTELQELPLPASAGSLCEGENRNRIQLCISVTVFQKMSFVKLS